VTSHDITWVQSQLEHKLSSANKSRHHYKEQWSHALKELAHMRQQEASASRQRLRQQEQELDHMRQQLLSHTHQQVMVKFLTLTDASHSHYRMMWNS